MIHLFAEDVQLPTILSGNLSNWIEAIITQHKKQAGDINYMFCSDEHILQINRQYLNHDYFTDIISFDYCTGSVISGDLVISIETVESNSTLFNTAFASELHRVIIHGVLHLLGYKDSTDNEKVIMRQQEDLALSLLSTFH